MSDDQAMHTKVRTLALLAVSGAAGFLIAPTLEKRVEALEQRVDQLERQLVGGQQVRGRERLKAQTPLDKFRAELAACEDRDAAMSLFLKFSADLTAPFFEVERADSLKPSLLEDYRVQTFGDRARAEALWKQRVREIGEKERRRLMDAEWEKAKAKERPRRGGK